MAEEVNRTLVVVKVANGYIVHEQTAIGCVPAVNHVFESIHGALEHVRKHFEENK